MSELCKHIQLAVIKCNWNVYDSVMWGGAQGA